MSVALHHIHVTYKKSHRDVLISNTQLALVIVILSTLVEIFAEHSWKPKTQVIQPTTKLDKAFLNLIRLFFINTYNQLLFFC